MRLPLLAARLRFLSFSLVIFLSFLTGARSAEPFFQKNDVIALVGGEDMVTASEYGYLELLLVSVLPDYHLKFRNLAFEGDTVFEQRRDLNFPSWEEQLDTIGATVVIVQFGQMECLAGTENLTAFIDAYGKLVERFANGGKRRVVLLSPVKCAQTAPNNAATARQLESVRWMASRNPLVRAYSEAIKEAASQWRVRFVDDTHLRLSETVLQRDGSHLSDGGHKALARIVGDSLSEEAKEAYRLLGTGLLRSDNVDRQALLKLIVAKNRLWFNYWRVQNWAFLAGDRTSQPSSRDDKDPSIRWFPSEREQFLPLIEAKEKEIDALAARLAQP